jgi:hypothetical protein
VIRLPILPARQPGRRKVVLRVWRPARLHVRRLRRRQRPGEQVLPRVPERRSQRSSRLRRGGRPGTHTPRHLAEKILTSRGGPRRRAQGSRIWTEKGLYVAYRLCCLSPRNVPRSSAKRNSSAGVSDDIRKTPRFFEADASCHAPVARLRRRMIWGFCLIDCRESFDLPSAHRVMDTGREAT